jgi:hypothetical protein
MFASFLRERGADQSASMGGHKIDHLRRYTGCCREKITLVFAVFIVDHNDHFARSDGLNGRFNGI